MLRNDAGRWQPNFYDHLIRSGEDWREQAWYIALNPVRAGLVSRFADYPFTGSLGCPNTDALGP